MNISLKHLANINPALEVKKCGKKTKCHKLIKKGSPHNYFTVECPEHVPANRLTYKIINVVVPYIMLWINITGY